MATLKIKNEHGGWDDIPALRGRDGAIQYRAGANIEISSDNVISARGLENTVTREDVTEMIDAAVPTDVSDLTNDAGYVTSADIPTAVSELTNDAGYATTNDIPTKTSDLINDGMGDRHDQFGYASVYPRDNRYAWGLSIEDNGVADWLIKPIVADVIVNKPLAFKDDLPTKLSDLTNDAGFVTSAAIPTKTSDLLNDSGFVPITVVPVNLSDLNNDTGFITANSLPTKTSDLTNDSGFITASSVPTNTSDLVNDSGFITSSDVPDVTSDLQYDSVIRAVSTSSSSYSITGIYSILNKILVNNNNQLDLRQFGILTIQTEDLNLTADSAGLLPFNNIMSYANGGSWDSTLFGTLVTGVDGQYDTMLQTSEHITAVHTYASHVEFNYSQQFLFVNKANILSGNTGNYALKSKLSTVKVTRYTN